MIFDIDLDLIHKTDLEELELDDSSHLRLSDNHNAWTAEHSEQWSNWNHLQPHQRLFFKRSSKSDWPLPSWNLMEIPPGHPLLKTTQGHCISDHRWVVHKFIPLWDTLSGKNTRHTALRLLKKIIIKMFILHTTYNIRDIWKRDLWCSNGEQ